MEVCPSNFVAAYANIDNRVIQHVRNHTAGIFELIYGFVHGGAVSTKLKKQTNENKTLFFANFFGAKSNILFVEGLEVAFPSQRHVTSKLMESVLSELSLLIY